MSQVNISLSANTAQYVKRLKDAKTQTDRNIIMMEQRIDKFANQVSKDFTSVSGSIDSMVNGLRTIKGGGYVAAIAALGLAGVTVASQIHQMNRAALESDKILKRVSLQMKETTADVQSIGAVVGSVGISLEKMGDISKDVFDKLGDYTATGGGAFQDFLDVVGEGTKVTADALQRMSSVEALSAMVTEMERVGASSAQVTFVLESIASDASLLAPLLENGANGFKKLKERMDELEAAPTLLKQTAEDIGYLDTASERFWANFGILAADSTAGAVGKLGEFFTWANNKIAKMNKENRTEAYAKSYKESGLVIDPSDTPEEMRNKADALEVYGSAETYEAKLKRLKTARDAIPTSSFSNISAEMYANLSLQIQAIEKLTEAERTLHDERIEQAYNSARVLREVANSKERKSKSGSSISSEGIDKAIGGSLGDDLDKELAKSSKALELFSQKAQETGGKIAELEARIAGESNATLKESLEGELNSLKAQQDSEINLVQAHAERITKINKKIADDEQKALKEAADKKAKDLKDRQNAELRAARHKIDLASNEAERIIAIQEQKDLKSKHLLENKEINESQLRQYQAQNEIKAETDLANSKLAVQMKLITDRQLMIDNSYAQQLQALAALKNEEGFTEEQHNLKVAELQRQHREEKLMLDAEYAATEFDRKAIERQVELEQMEADYENKLISYEGYLSRKADLDARAKEAEISLQLQQLSMMSEMGDTVASLAKDGSEAQKIAFAAQKGFAIAEAMLMVESNALKAKSAAMAATTGAGALAAGESAALISRIKDGVSIAAMTATAIGQFHDGSDEVAQTGSYILKQGERVVQPEANKDLTAYLKGNQKGTSTSTVKSDLVIQGDTTISDEKFQSMLVAHRENLTQAIKLAQRENPNLR